MSWVLGGILAWGFGAVSAVRAQNAPVRIALKKEAALKGDLLYWFSAGERSTPQKPLPAARPDGTISLDYPLDPRPTDAQLKILDVRQKRVARLPLRDLLSQSSESKALGPNLLVNGHFTDGKIPWILDHGPGTGEAVLDFPDDVPPPPGVKGKVARINVTALGAQNWHIQFFQRGLDLVEGETYTFRFWAKADRNRPLAINTNVDIEDGHGIGMAAGSLPLKAEWREFRFVFTATHTIKSHNRVIFLLGDALGKVDLAGVSLQAGKRGNPIGPNLLRNADFQQSLERWTAHVDPAPAQATVEIVNATGLPSQARGKVAHINVAKVGTQNWHIQFLQRGLDLVEGETYTFSFWARSDRNRPLTLVANLDVPDWHYIGLDGRVALTPEWRKYTMSFTAGLPAKDNNRVVFILGDAPGKVDIADVSLRREGEPGGAIEPLSLGASDFRYAQSVDVPVTFKGKPVRDVLVTLKTGDDEAQERRIEAAQNGVARFAEVPFDDKLALTVRAGEQSAEFTRLLAPDRPPTLSEIVLPEGWTGVQTGQRGGVEKPSLVGIWDTGSEDPKKQAQFTFNADGTGSIQLTPPAKSTAPPRAPVSNAFRWYLPGDGKRVVIGTRQYTWAIVPGNDRDKLTLSSKTGKPIVLYRR